MILSLLYIVLVTIAGAMLNQVTAIDASTLEAVKQRAKRTLAMNFISLVLVAVIMILTILKV